MYVDSILKNQFYSRWFRAPNVKAHILDVGIEPQRHVLQSGV